MTQCLEIERTGRAVELMSRDKNSEFVETLYADYHEKLLNYISSHSIDKDEAMDISQEAYMRMSRIPNPSEIKYPQAYLFRTALNVLRDKFRRNIPENRCVKNHDEEYDLTEAESTITPLRDLEAKRNLKKVQTALKRLSPNARNVFILHRFENMTYSQIATHYGITVSGVSKHMVKAIAHIAAAIETR